MPRRYTLMKRCTGKHGCGRDMPVYADDGRLNFPLNKRSKTGYASWCYQCTRDYYMKTRLFGTLGRGGELSSRAADFMARKYPEGREVFVPPRLIRVTPHNYSLGVRRAVVVEANLITIKARKRLRKEAEERLNGV